MIAGCPKCSARYRVDAEKIGEDGAKLRCTKCSAVFLVRAPRAAQVTAAPPAPVEAAPETSDDAPAPDEPLSSADRARLVLIADPDEERGKQSAEAVASWGLLPHLVHDGVEAMLAIQRMLPSMVVLDAALPKMFGFQVCEVVKRNESLRETTVVLVGAIHHQDRYRRAPSDLYGADVYLEQPDLPDGLLPLAREARMPIVDPNAGASAGQREAPTAEPPVEAALPPEPSVSDDAFSNDEDFSFDDENTDRTDAILAGPDETEEAVPDLELDAPPAAAPPPPAEAAAPAAEDPHAEERERAERLARIAVSEMLLYQPEKFDQANQSGNLEQALDMEIQEARALLRQRISEEVRSECDFILEELSRVAEERGAR